MTGLANLRRTWVFIASMLMVVAIHHAHGSYLEPEHSYLGFPYVGIDAIDWMAIVAAVAVVTHALPLNLSRPSAMVGFTLYVLVFLPTWAITPALEEGALRTYGLNLVALTLGFLLLLHIPRWLAALAAPVTYDCTLSAIDWRLFALLQLGCAAFLTLSFWDSIQFVGLSGTYEQRMLGRSRNWLEAYAQTYQAFVFSPALLAIGLIRRNPAALTLGLGGFFLVYSITAERTVFLMPAVLMAAFFVLRWHRPHVLWMVIVLGGTALLFTVSVHFRESSEVARLSALYLLFRTFSVPGAMLWQYQEVFGEHGYTFWSHVRGISFFVHPPQTLGSDAHWPQLGYIVAKRLLNLDINSNANLFAYDGIAGGGYLGLLLISGLLTAWLGILDRLSRGMGPYFPALISIPLGIVLANGPLFTMLLSFGGLFWAALLAAINLANRRGEHNRIK